MAEPTSREAMDMPANAAEDLGFPSLLSIFVDLLGYVIWLWMYRAAVAPKLSF